MSPSSAKVKRTVHSMLQLRSQVGTTSNIRTKMTSNSINTVMSVDIGVVVATSATEVASIKVEVAVGSTTKAASIAAPKATTV